MKKVLILKAPGTNCDEETYYAFKILNSQPFLVHINDILKNKKMLQNYDVIVIPGGFSYGDDISAGKILATKIISKLKEQILEFISNKHKIILGICNGFQVLVKTGILPDGDFNQKITLAPNDSYKFECRWVKLIVNKRNPSPIAKNLPDVIELPVAHAEGKFYCSNDTLEKLKSENQILLQYTVDDKKPTIHYPYNPNGSLEAVAGITNKQGNIIGLMPHPERFLHYFHYPYWTNKKVPPHGYFFLKYLLKNRNGGN